MSQGHMGQAALPRFGTHYAKVQPHQGAEDVYLSRNPTGRRRPSSPTGQQLLWLQVRPETYLYQNGYSPVGSPWRPPNSPGTATGHLSKPRGLVFIHHLWKRKKKSQKRCSRNNNWPKLPLISKGWTKSPPDRNNTIWVNTVSKNRIYLGSTLYTEANRPCTTFLGQTEPTETDISHTLSSNRRQKHDTTETKTQRHD